MIAADTNICSLETSTRDNAEVDVVVGDEWVYRGDKPETRDIVRFTMRMTPHGSRRSTAARGCEQHGEAHRPWNQYHRC